MKHLEAASLLLFTQIYLFNVLVLERKIRHKELRKKYKHMSEFDIKGIVMVRKKIKPIRKDVVYQKVVFITTGPFK